MKRVEMFESDDGKVYRTFEEATNRDLQLQFEEWYKSNGLRGDCQCTDVDFEDLWEWLSAHKTEVMQVLETIN